MENKTLQIEVQSLKLDNASLGSTKAKAEEECTRLRFELKQVWANFVKEKKDHKVAYQKQVDDMFFYEYSYSMRKQGITDDILSILSYEKIKLGEVVQVADGQGA